MVYEGRYLGKGKRFAVVLSRFNDFISRKLLEGAEDALLRHDVQKEDIDVYIVPGAYEIPSVAKKVAFSGKYNAVITLGAVIRGETPHFDYVANEVAKGVAQVGLSSNAPVVFGVLTTDNLEQAVERAGVKSGNKGFDAAMAALEMSNLFEMIDRKELQD